MMLPTINDATDRRLDSPLHSSFLIFGLFSRVASHEFTAFDLITILGLRSKKDILEIVT